MAEKWKITCMALTKHPTPHTTHPTHHTHTTHPHTTHTPYTPHTRTQTESIEGPG